jgi:hypothetical protein
VADRDLGEGTRLAALTGAYVCFEDEAGQSLRPQKAHTWAPRGHTPVVRVSGNAGRLPVAGMAAASGLSSDGPTSSTRSWARPG